MKNNKMLCGHEKFKISNNKKRCLTCSSFWDLDFSDENYKYMDDYPESRGHHNVSIGKMKIKSLQLWLKNANISLSGKVILEVGFGGAYPLKYMNSLSKKVYGIEVVEANINNAIELGISKENILSFNELPAVLPDKIDVWLFQDSFEHLLDPKSFLDWIQANSSEDSKILMILPEAGSPSERLMGSLWPHKLPDHQFHWSTKGVESFLSSFGWRLEYKFFPVKYISMNTVIDHLGVKFGFKSSKALSSKNTLTFPFNIGQQGLVFSKK